MSRQRRHRRSSSGYDPEQKSLIKGISFAVGLALFTMVGFFLVVRGFVK